MVARLIELLPEHDQHCCLVGQTGTGKTTMAEKLLDERKFVVCLDPKGTLNWPEYKRFTRLKEVIKHDYLEKIIYAPIPEELLDEKTINIFFKWIYDRRNCAIYIDELAAICENDSPQYLRGILTRGREFNISCYMSTQRPVSIPLHALSEAKSFFIFHLNLFADRKRLGELTPVGEQQIRELHEREFLFATANRVRGPMQLAL